MSRRERRSAWGEAVGERLAGAIENRYRQVEFAKVLGITEGTLSLWVNGAVPDQWQRLAVVCRAAGISADELLGLSAMPERQPVDPLITGRVPMAQVRDALLQLIARFDRRPLEASDSERLDRLEAEIRELRAELLTKGAIR